MPAAPLPTAFAAGRYTVSSLLGRGATKSVYLAHDTRLDRDVALAVVEGLQGEALGRAQRDARTVALPMLILFVLKMGQEYLLHYSEAQPWSWTKRHLL